MRSITSSGLPVGTSGSQEAEAKRSSNGTTPSSGRQGGRCSRAGTLQRGGGGWAGFLPDVLLVTAVALWAVGVSRIDTGSIGGLGLVPALPVAYFLSLACVVVAAGLLLSAPAPQPLRLTLCVSVLLVILYGTAPLVYAEPRYGWLYKQVGVVQYINLHGRLDRHIDIYQNWPGYFALAAWFDHVAGLGSPLPYAAWAQLFFEALFCTVIGYAVRARALGLTWREQWLAVLLFGGANWIAQDYLSPQALGYVLSMGVLAIALHWLSDSRSPRWLERLSAGLERFLGRIHVGVAAGGTSRPDYDEKDAGPADRTALLLLFFVFSVLVVVHELSPYVVAIQLGVLALVGRLKRKWVPPLMLAIAVGFLAPRFTFVNEKYGLLNSFGAFFGNLQPPSASAVHLSHDALLVAEAARLLSLAMWGLAALGAWRRYRSGRPALALAVLAFSPMIAVVFQHYGGEVLLRAYLFSLPWSACLAACALSPATSRFGLVGSMVPPVALAVSLALFLPAFFGADGYNVMTPSEVTASRYLYDRGRPGPVVYVDGNFPSLVGARYNLFRPSIDLLDSGLATGSSLGSAEVPPLTALVAGDEHGGDRTGYVVISRSMVAYAKADGFATPAEFRRLGDALSHSPSWQVFYRNSDVTIFELTGSS